MSRRIIRKWALGLVVGLGQVGVPHLGSVQVVRAETKLTPHDPDEEAKTAKAAADKVLALLGEATNHYRASRFDEARALSVEALALSERALGKDHPITAYALNNLGAVDLARQDPAAAARSFARALTILEANEGPQSQAVQQVAEFLAIALQAAGDLNAARPAFERVVADRQRSVGEGAELASDLVSLGEVCHELGDFGAARSHFERALAIRERALGADHPETAKALYLLGNALRAGADLRAARPAFERLLSLYEKVLGKDHPITLTVATTLALVELGLGDFKVARPRFEYVLVTRKRVLGPDHTDTAQAYNNLGLCMHQMGDLERALDAYERGLEIREKLLGKDSPELVPNLSNLGSLRYARGELRQALALFENALAILQRVPTPHDRQYAQLVATTLNNLGTVHQALGDRIAARKSLEQAAKLRVDALGKDHPETAQGFANLGAFLQANGDAKGAKPFFERALVIYEKALGKDHPDTATALDNLGTIELELGNLKPAADRLSSALAIRESKLGLDHPDTALSYNNLAMAMQRTGKLNDARALFSKSLAITDKRLGKTHPDSARTLNNLGVVSMAAGDTKAAIGYLTRAADIEEKVLASVLLGGTEAQKRSFAATVEASTHAWISLGLTAGDKAAIELAFETVARRKGRVLEAAADQQAQLRLKLPENQRGLFDALAEARRTQASLTLNPPSELAPEIAATLADEAAREGDRLEAELARASEAFADVQKPVDLGRITAARKKGTTLVELIVHYPFDPKTGGWAAPRYAAFVLSDKGLNAVDLGPVEPIEKLASELRREIAARKNASNIKAMANLNKVKRLGASLYQALFGSSFGSLEAALTGSRELVVSADGELTQVPFEALVDAEGRWLIERFGVSYLTSARSLVDMTSNSGTKRVAARSGAVVLGGVDYDGDATTQVAQVASRPDVNATRSADQSFAELRWKYLPGTVAELEGLRGVAAFSGAVALQGKAADEAALRALRGPKVLHVATHGFFLPDMPAAPELSGPVRSGEAFSRPLTESPLLRSGIALAGANLRDKKPGDDDGVLTALEASGLDLQGTELVVLSACETGVGDVRLGDGVVGLARALVLAGAQTQVMSLWQVDDDATRALMIAYYQRLARGEGKAEAMRQVRLAMLRGGANAETLSGDTPAAPGPWSHPFYWAAFLVHGDTGPLR